jgi:hypothetical protein
MYDTNHRKPRKHLQNTANYRKYQQNFQNFGISIMEFPTKLGFQLDLLAFPKNFLQNWHFHRISIGLPSDFYRITIGFLSDFHWISIGLPSDYHRISILFPSDYHRISNKIGVCAGLRGLCILGRPHSKQFTKKP